MKPYHHQQQALAKVFIFCALNCEAKPLIAAWRLKKISLPGLPFAIYSNQTRVLIISGVGKSAMAGAVGYVLGQFTHRHPRPLLINIGIAGHIQHALGDIFLVHKITDVDTGRTLFPQLPFSVPCMTSGLTTYSKPQNQYSADDLCDMEAAGFYEMAVKFNCSELTQVVKIVSDNLQSPVTNIHEAGVENWVGERLDIIESLIAEMTILQNLSADAPDRLLLEACLTRFHFTASHQSRLNALFTRWAVIKGTQEPDWSAAVHVKSAGQLIDWLEWQLEEVDFSL